MKLLLTFKKVSRLRQLNWRKGQTLTAVAVALAVVVFLPLPIMAAGQVSITRTFQPSSADTWVDQDNTATNYGSATTMSVRTRNGKNARSLVTFDISSIPTGSTVGSATLSLYLVTAPSAARTHGVHRVTGTWSETTVNWSNQPTWTATATVSTSTGTTGDVWLSWTVTSDVSAYVAGTATNYGWLVKDAIEDTPGAGITGSYATKENATTGNRPKLSVTFIAPWDSYEDSARNIIRDSFDASFPTVYMKGTTFTSGNYNVAYYDGGGLKVVTEANISVGADGILNSSCLLSTKSDATPGTWYVLVQPALGYTSFNAENYTTVVNNPDTYGLLANDSFEVLASAIPEFPTVIAGIIVAGACFALYYWLRKKRLAYVKA